MPPRPPFDLPARVAVIIPALDEEAAIGRVLDALPRGDGKTYAVGRIVVVDNGSRDRTAEVARAHGADVVMEPRPGYGSACLAGIDALVGAALPPRAENPTGWDIVAFLDGDFSDHPEELPAIVAPIVRGEADLVIGSRMVRSEARAALPPHARFGNRLATTLIQLLTGVRYTDLGPYRAIRMEALVSLGMRDRDYGWTVEMQLRAARRGLRAVEVPVRYRARIGRSKISGTLGGSIRAGAKILLTIARHVREVSGEKREVSGEE